MAILLKTWPQDLPRYVSWRSNFQVLSQPGFELMAFEQELGPLTKELASQVLVIRLGRFPTIFPSLSLGFSSLWVAGRDFALLASKGMGGDAISMQRQKARFYAIILVPLTRLQQEILDNLPL